jgi:ribonuclease E
MSSKLMLIDQSYDLETRVAILNGPYLEDFDCEFLQNKLKKGNIYLAKVSRVEASLQAAFIEYGEEKNGFLAFSEISPLYYQSQSQQSLEEEEDSSEKTNKKKQKIFKIQDVIKKNQIILVQVIKDVRGTKGAAFTTYISLPGKYCVLMPKDPKGSGISRKITGAEERTNLKKIVESLKIPEGISLVVRTAGMGKTKNELKRDSDYLLRLWTEIQKKQETATAPCLIYEESDLVARALRDLYSVEIEEILIQGEVAYKKAKAFMRMFMPSHAKRVHLHAESSGLFESFGVEDQIGSVYSSTVSLPSGGSIVINPTEALVAIDVNSAKSTKEKNIEDTALKTNMEAAVTIARQVKLRDLSGLIVIDFIDVSKHKNAQIENKLKECLKNDRARIQLGKISGFGLLEMSRERLRQSLLESTSSECPYCCGKGRVLSFHALSLKCLHLLEKEAKTAQGSFTAYGPPSLISYLLNEKRGFLYDIEKRFEILITLKEDPKMHIEDFLVVRDPPSEKEKSSLVETEKLLSSTSRKTVLLEGGSNKKKKEQESPQEVVEETAVVESKPRKRKRKSLDKNSTKVEAPVHLMEPLKKEVPLSKTTDFEEKSSENNTEIASIAKISKSKRTRQKRKKNTENTTVNEISEKSIKEVPVELKNNVLKTDLIKKEKKNSLKKKKTATDKKINEGSVDAQKTFPPEPEPVGPSPKKKREKKEKSSETQAQVISLESQNASDTGEKISAEASLNDEGNLKNEKFRRNFFKTRRRWRKS